MSLLPSVSLCPSFREVVGRKVVRALKREDDGISHASVDFLCALMQPMHDNFDLRQEQLNKRSLLSSKSFLDMLIEPFKHHVVGHVIGHVICHVMSCDPPIVYSCTQGLGTGALVISAILDFFTFAICPPYRSVFPFPFSRNPILKLSICIPSLPINSETTDAERFDMVLELISSE